MKVVYPNMSRTGQSQVIKATLQKAAALTPAVFSEMSFYADYESHVIYYIEKSKKKGVENFSVNIIGEVSLPEGCPVVEVAQKTARKTCCGLVTIQRG